MGAFPVRRGESDDESVKTSLELLERGQAVVIFPEGTRIRGLLAGACKRGVGRLALAERRARGADRDHRPGARARRVEDQAGAACTCASASASTYLGVESPSPFLAA